MKQKNVTENMKQKNMKSDLYSEKEGCISINPYLYI
jgi:hypothetical protein